MLVGGWRGRVFLERFFWQTLHCVKDKDEDTPNPHLDPCVATDFSNFFIILINKYIKIDRYILLQKPVRTFFAYICVGN
jgi:hypothetical protein